MRYVLSIGGSIINPGRIDTKFLKDFRELILDREKDKFIIVCGGGKPARDYITALRKINKVDESSKDLLGMSATWVNARLMNLIFKNHSSVKMPESVEEVINQLENNKVVACGGFFPGMKTDEDAAVLAELAGADALINLTNVDYVYDKDPDKHKDAKPYEKLSYEEYIGIVEKIGVHAGSNAPFSYYATILCRRSSIKIIVAPKDLNNLIKILNKKKKFKGTIIV